MKISYNLLGELLPVIPDVHRTSSLLTNVGLEVEGVTPYRSVRTRESHLVVGRVESVRAHPDADRLRLATVASGSDGPVEVVCGAPNLAEGQYVVLALPGAELYPWGEDKPFKIKRSRIRGVESGGMLCSAREIGLSEDGSGILVFSGEPRVGSSALDALGVRSDHVLEIGLTANRSDAMSHYGVARDLCANLNIHADPFMKPYIVRNPLASKGNLRLLRDDGRMVHLGHVDDSRCVRYCGLTLVDLEEGSTPQTIRNYLSAVGIKCINPIVDITNFVMILVGQPLHAFDLSYIAGREVNVQRLASGTPFVSLDGKEYTLSDEDLMICAGEEPLCLAGVYGGKSSGVSGETRSVFLESAIFDPVSIRRSARRHGLHTEASFRFERGVDAVSAKQALEYAALLIQSCCGGRVCGKVIDHYPSPVKPRRIVVSGPDLMNRIGLQFARYDVSGILRMLGFGVGMDATGCLVVDIPTYLRDVVGPEDISEELLRHIGYDKVEISRKLFLTLPESFPSDAGRRERWSRDLANRLVGAGFYEMMNLSLVGSGWHEGVSCYPSSSLIYLENPLSSDLDCLRPTLLWGFLSSANRNVSRQRGDLMLFEKGKVYWKEQVESEVSERGRLAPYHERWALCMGVCGKWRADHWSVGGVAHSLSTLKGFVLQFLAGAGLVLDRLVERSTDLDIYEYGVEYEYEGEVLCHAGEVKRGLRERFGLRVPAYYSEVNYERLEGLCCGAEVRYKELPRFPEVCRDLALLIDRGVEYGELRRLAFETVPDLLRQVDLFDVYEGDGIPEGKKSYALSFILQSEDRTLDDKTIEGAMGRLVSVYEDRVGATLRQ